MSERLEKIANEILAVVNKKRVSGETPEKDVWVATYLPNREQIAVIFGDREVSGSYVQKRFNKDDKQSILSTLEQLYGAEPRNHNEQSLDEDTVYDHSWYEVEDGDYPKRTKEGVMIKESYDEPIQVWNLELKKNPYISREEIFKAKEIFFKEICDHVDEYPNFKELVKVLQSLLDKGIINDKQYKFCRTNWDDLFGEYDPDVYGDSDLTETTCAGSVASVKKSVSKVTRAACLPKRKKKKMSESIDSILFKESILNDMPCESKIEGHQFKYFMNEGKWYLSADNCLVKTHDKNVMMETFDQIVDDEKVTTSLLEDYSCYEMELLMEDELAPTQSNPESESEMTSSPVDTSNSDSVSPASATIDDTTIANAIGGEMLKKEEEKEKNEPPKTSDELAKEELHNQEVLGSENQDGTIETEDGKTKDIKIGKTMDVNGKKDAITLYTDENGKEQMALTKDIKLKKV